MSSTFADLDILQGLAARSLPRGPGRFRVTLPPGFQEARLFALLLSRFGPPNGPLTFIGALAGGPPQGDPDGPFKWDFLLEFQNGPTIQITRTWLAVEMTTWGEPGPMSEDEALRFLDANIRKHSGIIDKALSNLEEAQLVINPYVRQKRIANLAKDQLLGSSYDPPYYPRTVIATREEIEKHCRSLSAFLKGTAESTFNAVILVTASAFMAEAFLNLMLAAMSRPPLVTNQKLLKKALREPWKDKLASLPVTCEGIAAHPDMGDVRVSNAEKLFNLRNRIAHSYPDPDSLGIGTIWFHKSVPVLPSNQPFDYCQSGADLLLPAKEEALEANDYAGAFVEYATSLVDKRIASKFKFFAESNPIAWIKATRRFTVPFGHTIFKVFLPEEVSSPGEPP